MASTWKKSVDTVVKSNKVADRFANMTLPKDKCTRCKRVVYATELQKSAKGDVFHKQCYSCAEPSCRQKLNHNNARTTPGDSEIYCQGHVPKMAAGSIGPDAMNMMRLKQYSDMQKKLNKRATLRAAKYDLNAYSIQGNIQSQSLVKDSNDNKIETSDPAHHFPAVLVDVNEQYQEDLRKRQEELEKTQREEEDAMFKKFESERKAVAAEAEKETEQEWEVKLKDIIAMFENKKIDQDEFERRKAAALKDFETRKAQRQKNKTLRVVQKQQRETSILVEKQGDVMLKLIKDQKDQLAKDMQEQLQNAKKKRESGDPDAEEAAGWLEDFGEESLNIEEVITDIIGTTEAPPPQVARRKKTDIMPDEGEDEEFSKVFDHHVATVAENEQTTFTELVHILTGPFMDDLSKARAIYRWITYKDLNAIQFSETGSDSPMGLLRGIKFGTETYHTLFKRLCSYAGLHCCEVNGKSKSVGYEPGMKFEGNMFRNTWNAVLIEGEWRLVQCNWGARFLVINKDKNEKKTPAQTENKDDSIKYQYDEHYFLTDPEDFIQEFFPTKPEWQLLTTNISQEEFESQPLVRSIFFHLGLKFKKSYSAVLDASKTGAVDIRILVPQEISQELAFLYQLRFSDKAKAQETEYCGAKLDRFVYQSMNETEVIYSAHVPANGEYYLQIFASRMETTGPGAVSSMDGIKLKCVCKFKIACDGMDDKMFPLPHCAPGEWGPRKASRQYNMTPVSHTQGVISAENNLKVKFTLGMPLTFLAKIRMRDVEDKFFQDFVDAQFDDEHLRVKVGFPAEGQYGLDIYAKPKDAPASQPLAHACKYLINVTKIQNPVDFGLAAIDNALETCMGNWGALPIIQDFGIVPLSHTSSWRIKTNMAQTVIKFSVPADVVMSAHLVREPDEDYREHLQIQRLNDELTNLNIHNIKIAGNYMLMIFARFDSDDSTVYNNIFNYIIKSSFGQS